MKRLYRLIWVNRHRLKHPLPLSLLTLTIALGSVVIVGGIILNLSSDEIYQLIFIMCGTGIATTITSYGLYRSGLLHHLGSLRWALMLIVLFTVGLILLIMWFLARLLFLDSHYITIAATMLVFAGLAAISFGFFVSKAIIDRLTKLAQAAGDVAGGDLTTRLNVQGNDEIAQLTRDFNTMAHNLQAVDEQKRLLEQTRRDLIAWVSHDLRTPLTSMRVMIESLVDGVIADDETQKRYLHSSLSEIEHLNHLIDDLFELAKLDVGHIDLNLQPTAIGDLISDTLSAMSEKARKKQITLDGRIALDVDIVQCAPDKIQRVLHNLIDNALQYTPSGENVRVRAYHCNVGIQVDVNNTGMTIPEDVLPNLFESFYRGERSRTTSNDGTRGTGLGLAIARGFIEAHQGHIWAESTDSAGTTFSFILPHRPA
jgi:signal transduction histidine kinase